MLFNYFPYLEPILERMKWSSREVVKEIHGRPTLTIRVHLEGPTFPHRAVEPVIRIGEIEADRVEVDVHGRWARGYFTRIPDGERLVEFGFDDGILFRFPEPFQMRVVERLDRRRLDGEVTIGFG